MTHPSPLPSPENSMNEPGRKTSIEAAQESIKRAKDLGRTLKTVFCVCALVACAFLVQGFHRTILASTKASEKLSASVRQSIGGSDEKSNEDRTLFLWDITCASNQLNSFRNPLKFAMTNPADIENQLIVLTLSCSNTRNPEQAKKLLGIIFNGPASGLDKK